METKFTFSPKLRNITFGMMLVGVVAIAIGFVTDPSRAWANLLLNNYYFLLLGLGASFFFALQYIAQAGWATGYKRVPEAIMQYVPVAGVIMLLIMVFGMKSLYPWVNPEEWMARTGKHLDEHDLHLFHHKGAYLNTVFFIARLVIIFASWVLLQGYLRKLSLREDEDKANALKWFEKSHLWSKIYIFVYALTFIFAAVDWIMSIETTWFSTIFAAKNFISAFYHGSAVIVLVVIYLHRKGFFQFTNDSHWLDFSRYLFITSILFAYTWYSQYMLIWYANIPEETIYYFYRRFEFSETIFIANIVINFIIPFIVILPNKLAKNPKVLLVMVVLILLGHYIDVYNEIFPRTVFAAKFGIVEIGSFIGFWGLFIFIVARSLAKANIIPVNHPYLDESLHHHTHG